MFTASGKKIMDFTSYNLRPKNQFLSRKKIYDNGK